MSIIDFFRASKKEKRKVTRKQKKLNEARNMISYGALNHEKLKEVLLKKKIISKFEEVE